MQLIGLALFFVTVDYKVHMLAFGSSWQWGCGEVGVRGGGRNRTSCYVKTNLSREKQCLRPPLKVLQVVRVPDIFKQRVMEAISLAPCERSSAIASCLSDRQWWMYKDKWFQSAAPRRNNIKMPIMSLVQYNSDSPLNSDWHILGKIFLIPLQHIDDETL